MAATYIGLFIIHILSRSHRLCHGMNFFGKVQAFLFLAITVFFCTSLSTYKTNLGLFLMGQQREIFLIELLLKHQEARFRFFSVVYLRSYCCVERVHTVVKNTNLGEDRTEITEK